MFVDYNLPRCPLSYSKTPSLRVQQFLFELSPTCVCPNFSSMVQELQHQKSTSASSPCAAAAYSSHPDDENSPPLHLMALALKTTRPRSLDSRLCCVGSTLMVDTEPRNQKLNKPPRPLIPARSSEDLTNVGKLNGFEAFAQGFKERRLLSCHSLALKRDFHNWKTAPRYRHLAETSVKLAMSCWAAGRHDVPKIRIHRDVGSDSQFSNIPRSSSLSDLNAVPVPGSSKTGTRSNEDLRVPPANGVAYSMEEIDELRASVYLGSENSKRSTMSPSATSVVGVWRDSFAYPKTAAPITTERKCRSYAELEQNPLRTFSQSPHSCHAVSSPAVPSAASGTLSDLCDTADVLGQALERHLKKQSGVFAAAWEEELCADSRDTHSVVDITRVDIHSIFYPNIFSFMLLCHNCGWLTRRCIHLTNSSKNRIWLKTQLLFTKCSTK